MIRQIIKYSILVSFIVTASLWVLKNDVTFLGLALGSLWGSINLYLIEILTKELLIKKNVLTTSGLMFIKFPLLYWIGYKCLTFTETNPWCVIGGLTLIFIVALFRALIPMYERIS